MVFNYLKEGKIFNIAPVGTASFFCFLKKFSADGNR